ncbi:MAG TPA: hypothetical protein VI365_36070 [Trebonia sp.]
MITKEVVEAARESSSAESCRPGGLPPRYRPCQIATKIQAFAGFAEAFVQLRASSCGLHAALSGDHGQAIDGEVTKLREAVHKLVVHAQQADALRGDIDWSDIPFVLASAIPADHTIGMPARQDQWQHNLRIILDGIRAPGSTRRRELDLRSGT